MDFRGPSRPPADRAQVRPGDPDEVGEQLSAVVALGVDKHSRHPPPATITSAIATAVVSTTARETNTAADRIAIKKH